MMYTYQCFIPQHFNCFGPQEVPHGIILKPQHLACSGTSLWVASVLFFYSHHSAEINIWLLQQCPHRWSIALFPHVLQLRSQAIVRDPRASSELALWQCKWFDTVLSALPLQRL